MSLACDDEDGEYFEIPEEQAAANINVVLESRGVYEDRRTVGHLFVEINSDGSERIGSDKLFHRMVEGDLEFIQEQVLRWLGTKPEIETITIEYASVPGLIDRALKVSALRTTQEMEAFVQGFFKEDVLSDPYAGVRFSDPMDNGPQFF